ncbi:MAG: tRNA (adenosine(37)-N6)-threonylcarbamoyltransferase complex ATPase subunit type 1 TsaE [Desulfobacteraceae bacterium]|nr:MAG: tRNA (adenosine(37)-N6)-threonylcarbamoyltransferase complex ATPase subunit type 1 TsaE [Desulfobacteraceae bacterium]
MATPHFITRTGRQTTELGQKIGKLLRADILPDFPGKGFHMALNGDLGAGKTTFVQGLARGLNVPESYYITSPTFNIINEYPCDGRALCHIDLYRLGAADELEFTGFQDLLDQGNILIVEWPQMLMDDDFFFDLVLDFHLTENFSRKISFSGSGQPASNLLQNLFS